jgi:predicted nucleotidyltransferase
MNKINETTNPVAVNRGLMKLEQHVQDEIAAIKNVILKTIPVERMYLFGSYAYGIPDEDSDIDIYVVMNDDAQYGAIEAEQMIYHAIHGQKSLPTDILVRKKHQFQHRVTAPTLEQEIAEKGVVIYG